MNTALNYQPEVLVDTADLSREDWLDYRRLGRRRGRKLGSERSGTPPGRFGCHDFCQEDWT